MLSPDDLRRLFRDAADQQRRLTSADWLAWLGDHGDRLMEGMGAWLDLVRGGDLPWHAGETTKAMLTLWAAPGLVKRPDVVQVAACFAATCPAELGRDFNYGDEVPNALGRLLRARAGVPDLPVQILLWQASLRADLGWGARLVCARFAFPHNAADLRDRLLNTDFHDDAALAHQSWLLRFADHPEFNATWGALFESADYAERRALLDAVQGDAERAAVLRALAWLVTRRPLGPADAIAGFAGAVGVPAAGVFLTWYAEHGPARGVPNALAGLQRWHGDAVQAVLDRVASAARDRADARAAGALRRDTAEGPPPEDGLSRQVAALLEGRADPGGLGFADRQIWAAAWREAMGKDGEPLSEAERARYVERARHLVHGRHMQREGLAREWASEAMTVVASPPWRGHAGGRALVLAALAQTGDPGLRRSALRSLWQSAEAGEVVLDDAAHGVLGQVGDHGLQPADQFLLANLRVIEDPAAWRRLAKDHLGDAPPVGVQRHLLTQPADDAARAALGVVFEVCNEVQRRGLLDALQAAVPAGYQPVYLAVAAQAAPQTATVALRALGRVGDRESVGALHRLAEDRPELKAEVEAALSALRPGLAQVPGAQAGALALSSAQVGALSDVEDGPGGGPHGSADALVLKLRPDLAFDRLAAPPRRVPLSLWFVYLTTGASRWGLLWSAWVALATFTWLKAHAGDTGWMLGLGVGLLGLLVSHWLADTVLHLRLLRGGRTAQARSVKYWTRWSGSKGNRTQEHVYDFEFVAEDGQPHEVRVTSSEVRRELNDEAVEGIVYLVGRDGRVGVRRPLDALRPARVDEAGRLRARWNWLLWALAAFAPWPFVLLEAWDRLG